MAQPRRKATFFVTPSGVAIKKAKRLNGSERWKILHKLPLVCVECKSDVVILKPRNIWVGDKQAHIDHILPVSRGGQNDLSNLRVLCGYCNMSKGSK